MRLSPTFLVCAAGLVTLGVGQALAPTVHAQSAPAVPALRISVQSLNMKQTLGGAEVTGRIVNTGRQALSYPSVVCVFTNASGQEVGRAGGYLLAGPVAPGQSVGLPGLRAERAGLCRCFPAPAGSGPAGGGSGR